MKKRGRCETTRRKGTHAPGGDAVACDPSASLSELRKRVSELAGLSSVSQRISGVLSLEEVVPLVLEQILRCVEPDMALLFIRDRSRLILKGARSRRPGLKHAFTPTHRVGECLCGMAVQRNRPIYCADIQNDRRCTWLECKQAGLRSFAALPLSCHRQVLGVLGLASAEPRDFSGQAEFLETLANSISVALRNAELYDKLLQQRGELMLSQRALRELSGRLIRAHEEERRRIARELHDDLNQRLALIAVELDVLADREKDAENRTERLQRLAGLARQLSSEVHRLCYQLHPATLEHLGLVAAMRGLCRELSAAESLQIDFVEAGLPAQLSPDAALCLYRVLQEALRNVVKHSGAGAASVALAGSDKCIELTVTDAGRGFEPADAAARGGLGLVSMRERLRSLSGTLEIVSAPGQGTHITARLPAPEAGAKPSARARRARRATSGVTP